MYFYLVKSTTSCKYSANNKNCQINVIDKWHILIDDTFYYCRYKGNIVQFFVRLVTAQNFPTTWTDFGGGPKIPQGYRPSFTLVSTISSSSNVNTRVNVQPNGNVARISLTGSEITSTGYFAFEWTI